MGPQGLRGAVAVASKSGPMKSWCALEIADRWSARQRQLVASGAVKSSQLLIEAVLSSEGTSSSSVRVRGVWLWW